MAESGIALVYGGGAVGLMGIIARRMLADGGHVTGVIPGHLYEQELGLEGVSELVVSEDMHERKKVMFRRSDAFLALPGGIGTLDETVELITWAQLGLHRKPVLLLDHEGYWQPFLRLIDHMIAERFSGPDLRGLFRLVASPAEVLAALRIAV